MPRILIVDDEPGILSLLRLVFVQAGYEVFTAESSDAAIDLCGSHTFDVLLSDVRMPGMDGHALARWVAAHQPTARPVLMSGYDVECEACPLAPRCTIVPKPFNVQTVLRAVEREARKNSAAA